MPSALVLHSFLVMLRHWRVLFLVILVCTLPSFLLDEFFLTVWTKLFEWIVGAVDSSQAEIAVMIVGGGGVLYMLTSLTVNFGIAAFLSSAIMFSALYLVRGKDLSFRLIMKEAGYSWMRVVESRIIHGFLIGLGFICFVLPGVFLLIRYMFVDCHAALESNGSSSARAASVSMGRPYLGNLFLMLTFLLFVDIVIYFSGWYALEFVPESVSRFMGIPFHFMGWFVMSHFVLSITLVYLHLIGEDLKVMGYRGPYLETKGE